MVTRPRRSVVAPKRFSPPPLGPGASKKRGQQTEESENVPVRAEEENVEEEIPTEQREEEQTPSKKIRTAAPKSTSKEGSSTPKAQKNIPIARTSRGARSASEEVEAIESTEYRVPEILLSRAKQQSRVSEIRREEVQIDEKEAPTTSKRKRVRQQIESNILSVEDAAKESETVVETTKSEEQPSIKKKKKHIEETSSPATRRSKPQLILDKIDLPSTSDEPHEKAKASEPTSVSKPSSSTAKKPEPSSTKRDRKSKEMERSGVHNKLGEQRQKDSSFDRGLTSKSSNVAKTVSKLASSVETAKKSSQEAPGKSVLGKKPSLPAATSSSSSKLSTKIKKPSLSLFVGDSSLLDGIPSKQESVIRDRNKIEQEKAEEYRRLEIEKRRRSSEMSATVSVNKGSSIPATGQFKKPLKLIDTSKKPGLVKKPSLPSPSMAASSSSVLGLLDSILDEQDSMMRDRNKTEQERAEERQRLEFERRRRSSENPFEKGAVFKPSNKPASSVEQLKNANETSSTCLSTQKSSISSSSVSPASVSTPGAEISVINEKIEAAVMEEEPKRTEEDKHVEAVEEEPKRIEEDKHVEAVDLPTQEEVIMVEESIPVVINLDEIDLPPEPYRGEPIETVQQPSLVTSELPSPSFNPQMSIDENMVRTEEENRTKVEIDRLKNANLLATANVILENLQQSGLSNAGNSVNITYEQIAISDDESSDSARDPDEKPPMDFYGDPVPDEEDEDDKLFEMAAGLSKSKKGEVKKIEEEPLPNNEMIELDYYNADINIKSDVKNKWLIDPENGDGFALMWGCVRSNYGLCLPSNVSERSSLPPLLVYQVQIKEYLYFKHLPFAEHEAFDVRVGWSANTVRSIIGESHNSYAYCTTGRKASGNIFSDYGQDVQIGEFITVVLDLMKNEMRIILNNEDLGVTFSNLQFNLPTSTTDYSIVFPHIGLKNVRAFVNFGVELPDPEGVAWPIPSYLIGKPYKFFGELSRFPNCILPTPRPPPSKSDCTVIFMVGLPAAGKSKWVEQYLREHENERWIVINSEVMLDLMRVNGVPRKRVHQGRWDAVMGQAAKATNRAFQLICRRRHNYIIDQTNVFRDKRKQKLALFQDFVRKCVVLVPSAEDFEHRQMKQARDDPTDQITPEALLQLKGMFTLPEIDQEPVEEVIFIEPPAERVGEAVEMVRRFNEEGRPYLPIYNQRRR